MKTAGIIGGTSWLSTVDYYSKINELVNKKMGNSHSAKVWLYSVDFSEFKNLVDQDKWNEIGIMFSGIAQKLQFAGADFIALASNTPHTIADVISNNIDVPVLHIATSMGETLHENGIKKIGLIGTKPTMEKDFFKNRLANAGVTSIVANKEDREFIHKAVFNELTQGIFLEETKVAILAIITKLKEQGADAIVFGCTELILLINPSESSLPVYDTAEIHIQSIVEYMTK